MPAEGEKISIIFARRMAKKRFGNKVKHLRQFFQGTLKLGVKGRTGQLVVLWASK